MSQMYNPPHPAEVLKELWLDEIDYTITGLAIKLDVSRQTMSNFLNCKMGITPEFAVKLAKAFNTTPSHWLGMQIDFDLWQLQKNSKVTKKLLKNVQTLFPNHELHSNVPMVNLKSKKDISNYIMSM
jgi:antitoxin HigA-1